ncbi:MAG: hypothetical protein ACM3RP_13295 [Chitinophagales bacterium]
MEKRWRRGLLVTGLLLAGLIGLVSVAPEDRTLGANTRLVYLHGAFILASLLFYGVAGVLGLVHVVGRRERAFALATTAWTAAVAANLVSLPLGLYAAKVIWGALFWGEPRFVTNFTMLLVSLLVAGVALLSSNRRGVALLYPVAAGFFAIILRQTGRVMHPVNPIGRSDSWAIKLSFLALLLLVLALAWEALRPFVWPGRRSHT